MDLWKAVMIYTLLVIYTDERSRKSFIVLWIKSLFSRLKMINSIRVNKQHTKKYWCITSKKKEDEKVLGEKCWRKCEWNSLYVNINTKKDDIVEVEPTSITTIRYWGFIFSWLNILIIKNYCGSGRSGCGLAVRWNILDR